MAEAPKSDPPINLNGKVKLGIGTLVAIAIGVFTLAGIYWKLPSKADIKEMLTDHNDNKESHPQLANDLSAVRMKAERIEERQKATREDVTYIRDRIDYLTETVVRQNTTKEALERVPPGRARKAANAAVEKLKGGAQPAAAVQDSIDDL